MFKITATQAINWSWIPFKLKAGENTFSSPSDIKAEAWEKLRRFREMGFVEFEDPPEPAAPSPQPADGAATS